MSNFKKILKLEEKLIDLTSKISGDIDRMGQINVPDQGQQIVRIQHLLFLKFSIQFFVQRANFIIKIISNDDFTNEEKGITKIVFRGMIEAIARVGYAKQRKEECVKNFLWDQLKSLLIIPKYSKRYYQWLKKIKVGLPTLDQLAWYYKQLCNSLFSPNEDGKKFLTVDEKLSFPKTKKLIQNYWIDKKPFNRIDAYWWYRVLSNPTHAELIYEGIGSETPTIDCQLLSFLIMLHKKFIEVLMPDLSVRIKKEIEKTIKEIDKDSKDFIKSYSFKRKFLRKF